MSSKAIRKQIAEKSKQAASYESKLVGWREQMKSSRDAADAAQGLFKDALSAAALADNDDGAAVAKAESKARAAAEKRDRDEQVLGEMIAVAETALKRLYEEIAGLDAAAKREAHGYVLAGLRDRLEELRPGMVAYLAAEVALCHMETPGTEIRGDDFRHVPVNAIGRIYQNTTLARSLEAEFVATARGMIQELADEEAER